MSVRKGIWKAKSRLASITGHLGGYALARLLTSDSPRILMYHRFASESSDKALGSAEFEYHVREIVRYFRPKTLERLAAELKSPQGIESRSVVITVDDGYEDFHSFALPVLHKYRVPATLFVTTDFIDQRLWLWPDIIEFALEHCRGDSVELEFGSCRMQLDIVTRESRSWAWKQLVRISLGLPEADMRALHAHLLERCEVALPARPIDKYKPLSWKQVREAEQQGVEIGAHTRTHPALSRVPLDRLREEIAGSKQRIEEMLGHQIASFCYPNGTPDDVSDDVKRSVAEAGFVAAPVAYFDEHVTSDVFELRRYPVDSWRRKFLQRLHGVELLTKRRRARSALRMAARAVASTQ